jgi:hypothetical protein
MIRKVRGSHSAIVSTLSEREMEQLYVSLKKLGLLATEKLEETRDRVQERKGTG